MYRIVAALFCLSGAVVCNINITAVPTSPDAWAPYGSFWDHQTQSFYIADILSVLLYRYSYEENKVYTATADGVFGPAFLFPIRGSSTRYVTTGGPNSALVVAEWDGRSSTAKVVDTVFSLPPDQLLNSAFATPNGDLSTGTYSPTLCNITPRMPFYRYSKDGGLVEIASNFRSTVGVYLMESTQTMYHMDGCWKILSAFDYNSKSGGLSNQRIVQRFKYPDNDVFIGLTGDTEGNLYWGDYNRSTIHKFDTVARKVVAEYKLPNKFMGSSFFGGPQLDTLLATTGAVPINFSTGYIGEPISGPNYGDIFLLNGLGAKGAPAYRPRI